MQLVIKPCGTTVCIYDEELELHALGAIQIERASHVEPTPDGRWTADMRPVGGPVLGPFHYRSQALGIEQRWLEMLWLPEY